MVSLQTVEGQLKQAGCNYRLWGRGEIRELCNILMPGETIAYAVNGYYEGGFAMLCVTDQRLLLVDHKPMFLTLEDIRFDMISEVDYYYRLLNATSRVMTPNQVLTFTSWNQSGLRKVASYTQQRVMELRQQQMMIQQFQPSPQMQFVPAQVQVRHSSPVTSMKRLAKLALHERPSPSRPVLNPALAALNGTASKMPINPYNKVPLLSRRRQFPRFY